MTEEDSDGPECILGNFREEKLSKVIRERVSCNRAIFVPGVTSLKCEQHASAGVVISDD